MRIEERQAFSGTALTALIAMGMVTFSPAARAVDNSCIDDVWKAHGNNQNLTCTANDVRVAKAVRPRDLNGNTLETCLEGQTFSFVADFEVVLGAQARYDVGMYFSTDGDPNGDGALRGQCAGNVIQNQNTVGNVTYGSDNWVQLDAPEGNICGDTDGAHASQFVTVPVLNAVCEDSDGDGKLNLPNCTSWRTSGNNAFCDSTTNDVPSAFDAYPGSPSKCNCDKTFNVPIRVETGTIEVTKTADSGFPDHKNSLPQPGGAFTYTVDIENKSQFQTVTIERICDDQYGKIAGNGCPLGSDNDAETGDYGSDNSTTCTVPQSLGPGASYSCTFVADFWSSDGVGSLTDVVAASGKDGSNNPVSDDDTETVQVTNVPPTAMVIKSLGVQDETCADVIYAVEVRNTSNEPIYLHGLSDTAFGDITKVQGDVLATDCVGPFPATIASGSDPYTPYTCSFTAEVCGSHTNKVTATVKDTDAATITPESNTLEVEVNTTTAE